MANKKISELTAQTAIAIADLFATVDISADETKKATLEVLLESLLKEGGVRQQNLLTNSGFEVWSNSTVTNYGSQITITDVTSGVCTTSNTQDLAVGSLFKFDSGDFSGELYEVTAVVADTSFTLNDTSLTDSGSPGTGYEVTPGCVAADALAFDGWVKDTTLDLYREPNGTNTKDGVYYSLKCTPSAAADWLRWPNSTMLTQASFYKRFAGKTVCLGIWCKCSTASHARLQIDDGVATENSSYHTGGGSWEWLEISMDVSSSATQFSIELRHEQSSGITYWSQPMLIFGMSIGEGNYKKPENEWIFDEKTYALTDFDSASFSDVSSWTDINLEAQSKGRISKNCKAIFTEIYVKDSNSAANETSLSISGLIEDTPCFYALPLPVNDRWGIGSGIILCNVDGDVKYKIVAGGTGTFDIVFYIFGVLV